MSPVSTGGLAVAALFLSAQGAVVVRVLREDRRRLAAPVEQVRRSVDTLRRILVPIIPAPHSERGVLLACRLGSVQGARLLILHVMEIPRTLPLSAPAPELEAAATQGLERALRIARAHGLEAETHRVRARIAGEEIVRFAVEADADLIVLGARPRGGLRDEILGRTSDIVLREAPCEVVLDTAPAGVRARNGGTER